MLQSRLILATTAVAFALGGCAGADGTDRGVIRENVIEPGITAIDQSTQLACDADAHALDAAMQSYELLEGSPPQDQAALVTGQYLREPSELWDLVDGRLVSTDPGCTKLPDDLVSVESASDVTAPADDVGDIITGTEPPLTADQTYATFTPDQIGAVGGEVCARELASIFSAAERYVTEVGGEPADLAALVDAGYLVGTPSLWQLTDDQLVPVDGSGCIDVDAG
ncbi:MAG: hypothetical protein ABIO83_07680 [Ilumatobacteraceae bacterium]